MHDHFRVHRWTRDAPRLVLLAVVSPHSKDSAVRARVRRVQDDLRFEPVTLVPPEWLHVTIATLDWADQIATGTYHRWRDEITTVAGARSWPAPLLGRAGAGLTGARLSLIDADLFATAGSVAKAAGTALGRDVAVPASPHLGVAYSREDKPEIRLDRALGSIEDGVAVSWDVDRLQVVHLVQDRRNGFYTWTVLDELPVTTHRSAP